MELRLVPASLLLLGSVAIAQTPILPVTPQQPATPAPARQDPDKPQQTPDDQIKELSSERDRLNREILYARDRAKNSKAMLAEKLANKPQNWKAIDAGTNAPAVQPMVPTTPRQARVATGEEMQNQGNDTLMLVNGRPVLQRSLDALMTYLATSPTSGDEAARTRTALFELIRIESIASAFDEHEALERVGDVLTQVDSGKTTLAEMAGKVGVVPGANADGKIEVTRNSPFGVMFEQVAFGTEAGKRARPFRNANGLVILQVDKVEKGERPELDKVHATAVQIGYTPDQQSLIKAHTAVNQGQVDLLVRDQKVLDSLPEMFRRPAGPAPMAAPVMSPELQELQKQLVALGQAIAPLQGKTDDESKAKLDALMKQYEALKGKMRAAQSLPPAPGDDKAGEIANVRAMLNQLAEQMGQLGKDQSEAGKQKLKVFTEQYAQLKERLKQMETGGADSAPIEIRQAPKVPEKKN